jgi:hypothetical protein
MARGYKPTKKGLMDFLNFAIEVAQIARPEYKNVSEGEALQASGTLGVAGAHGKVYLMHSTLTPGGACGPAEALARV